MSDPCSCMVYAETILKNPNTKEKVSQFYQEWDECSPKDIIESKIFY